MGIPKPTKRPIDPDKKLFDAGVEEGRLQMKAEVLTLLETKYMEPKIVRGTERGNAILQVAKEIAEELKVK